MKPIPTDSEIAEAIHVLLRAQVLREYHSTIKIAGDLLRHSEGERSPSAYERHAEDQARRVMAAELVDVLVGRDNRNTSPNYRGDIDVRLHGWVISYADVRRAIAAPLPPKETT